jgi:hypothetical protein
MSGIGFRDATDHNTALTTLLVYTGAGGSMDASFDNFYENAGLDLTNPVPVPEPATMTMLALGLGGLFLRKRK